MSIGYNKYGNIYKKDAGIHAEEDALLKLRKNNNNKLESIHLLVIRISTNNKLQSSKPCSACLKVMNILPIKKGYKIKNIYYSDGKNNIVKTKLSSLEKEEKHYTKYYRSTYYNRVV